METKKIVAYNALTGEESTIEAPVVGIEENTGLPILGLKMMSDETWKKLTEQQGAGT